MEVYWSPGVDQSEKGQLTPYEHLMLSYKPKPLTSNFVKANKHVEGFANYIKCPSVKQHLDNTFVVRAHEDVTFRKVNGEVQVMEGSGVEVTQTGGTQILQLDFSHYFISETSLRMTMLPAFYHNPIFNFFGGMNVGKWARPVVAGGFFTENNCGPFYIKRGDPLYYVYFETDESVHIRPFEINHEISRYLTTGKLSAKTINFNTGTKKLSWFYNLLGNNYRHKQLIKQIKLNLVD